MARYVLMCGFKDKPECAACKLSGAKGLDIKGETVIACYGLCTRPKCPEEGCRDDCPLVKEE